MFEKNDAKLHFRRSVIPFVFDDTTTMQHGFLYPVFKPIETLATDTWNLDCNFMTVMSTPIYPIMSNIYQYYAAFNVPRRILWDHEKQFCGEASDKGIANSINLPNIPAKNIAVTAAGAATNNGGCFGNAFRFVVDNIGTSDLTDVISVLPIRAFLEVYNEYVRNPNFCSKYLWNRADSGYASNKYVATLNGNNIQGTSLLPKVMKMSDAFTDCLPWQSKGSINFGNVIDIGTEINSDDFLKLQGYAFDSTGQGYAGQMSLSLEPNGDFEEGGTGPINAYVTDTSAYQGDPSSATVEELEYISGLKADTSALLNIKKLKEALLIDNYYTALLKAPRYKDYLRVMFGEEVSDDLVDVPQFLGGFRSLINIDRVYQTTGHEAGETTTLGAVGAHSVTRPVTRKLVPNVTIKENGYLVIVSYFKHERSYSQGLDPIYTKISQLDFYQTQLAGAPDVPVSDKFLFWDGIKDNQLTFGFNQYGWDYMKTYRTVRGMINPAVSSSLDFVTLADVYDNAPTLGQSWIEEDRNALARCLTTGIDGIDYIVNTTITGTATRVVGAYKNALIGAI